MILKKNGKGETKMTTKSMIQAILTLAGALLCGGTVFADKPSWCTNGVLMETKSFSDSQEASNFANSQSGSATINGATHVVIGTVNVVQAPVGNRVYVVQIWDCTKAAPGNNGNNNNGAAGQAPVKAPGKVTYTLDPHPELDRNGKPRVQAPPPQPPAPRGGATSDKPAGRK
jgi:hypothetical protein